MADEARKFAILKEASTIASTDSSAIAEASSSVEVAQTLNLPRECGCAKGTGKHPAGTKLALTNGSTRAGPA